MFESNCFDKTIMLCPYCNNFSSCGVISFVKESMRKHIREIHTLEEIRGYQGQTTVTEQQSAKVVADDVGRSQKALKDAFPTIERLLNNPDFCQKVNNAGYEFDLKAILDAFGETFGVELLKSCKEPSDVPQSTFVQPRNGGDGRFTSAIFVLTDDLKKKIRDMMQEAHARKYIAKKTGNKLDEYYQAGVYSGLSRALWKLTK